MVQYRPAQHIGQEYIQRHRGRMVLARQHESFRAALRNWISPPSRLANSRLIASLRPVPPYLRLVPASACWKASKMIRCLSDGIPIPVSVTSKVTTDAALPRIG